MKKIILSICILLTSFSAFAQNPVNKVNNQTIEKVLIAMFGDNTKTISLYNEVINDDALSAKVASFCKIDLKVILDFKNVVRAYSAIEESVEKASEKNPDVTIDEVEKNLLTKAVGLLKDKPKDSVKDLLNFLIAYEKHYSYDDRTLDILKRVQANLVSEIEANK